MSKTNHKTERERRWFPFSLRRLLSVCTGISVYLAVLATAKPSPARGYNLNPLTGPLWLLGTHADADNVTGAVPCIALGLSITLVTLWPNRYSAALIVLSLLLWFCVGVWACGRMGA